MNLKEAITELRKNEKRNFSQSIDMVVNLRGIDPKRDNISTIISIPHKVKEKRICGFFTKKSNAVQTITQAEFPNFKDKKALKGLVADYDFFIATASLMPSVATNFGKVLGPAGKMPSPQLGVVMQENDDNIKQLVERIGKAIKVRVKEASVKMIVGKENMTDEQLAENIQAAYNGLVAVLPTKKENVKNVMVKLTMSKPIKVEMK